MPLFNHGERFYGFKGLRDYKAKFHPLWQPRYIAGPHGLAMIRALTDLNSLISAMPESYGQSAAAYAHHPGRPGICMNDHI